MPCPQSVDALATLLPPIGLSAIVVEQLRETLNAKISKVIAIVRYIAIKQKSNAENDKLKTLRVSFLSNLLLVNGCDRDDERQRIAPVGNSATATARFHGGIGSLQYLRVCFRASYRCKALYFSSSKAA